jgi:hypothetical protein
VAGREMGKKKSSSSSSYPRYKWCGDPLPSSHSHSHEESKSGNSKKSQIIDNEIHYLSLEIEYNKTKTLTISIGDCVFLVSGVEQEPYIAKIWKMYENPKEPNKKFIVTKWFYRPGNCSFECSDFLISCFSV